MPTNPIDAKRIADRTMQLIGDLDRARTAAEVKRLCGDWFEFADAMRVCRAIREHVIDKRRGLLAELEPMSRPADRKMAAAGAD